jgi:hypothetical protein
MINNKFLSMLYLLFLLTIPVSVVHGSTTDMALDDEWFFITLGDDRQQLGIWDNDLNHYTHDNTSNPIRKAMMDTLLVNYPDMEFILHTGDIVASGAEQDDWNRYYEDVVSVVDADIPIYYAVGNHEYYRYALGAGVYDDPQEDLATYLANVELPGQEKFYSFDFRDLIHFVIINTNENYEF